MRRAVIVMLDGLRRDFVTEAYPPRLHGFAHRAEPVQEGAADIGSPRTQRARLQDVLARADTAVHVDFDFAPHSVDDRRQGLNRRGGAVQLAPTVVGNNQRVGARVDGQSCVFHILNALEDQLAAPAPLDPFDVGPVQRRVELLAGPGA